MKIWRFVYLEIMKALLIRPAFRERADAPQMKMAYRNIVAVARPAGNARIGKRLAAERHRLQSHGRVMGVAGTAVA